MIMGFSNLLLLLLVGSSCVFSKPASSLAEGSVKELADANNRLAVGLYREFLVSKDSFFFSPLSISTAMAMLYRGAKGNTAEEMRLTLGYEDVGLSDSQVHQSYGTLLSKLDEASDEYVLDVANSVLTQSDFPILADYKQDLQKLYKASVREVDFQKDGAKVTEEVNQWVREKTREKIQKLVDNLDPSTRLLLLNAVYFKGTWQTLFETKKTKPGDFYNRGLTTEKKQVPLMHLTEDFRYGDIGVGKVLELPYKGKDVSMFVFLPNAKNGLEDLEVQLASYTIGDIKKSMFKTEVEVTLPKFKLEFEDEMSEVLQQLGIKKVFGRSADLSGISENGNLAVDQVIHKAVIEVNEEGSEAAAVTGIRVVITSSIPPPKPVFKVDHPFAFAIVDNRSDLILFLGRVNQL